MSEEILYEKLKGEAKSGTFWMQHRFFLLVAGAIVVALFLVGIALNQYHSSGTAQLDLSRPGYQSVRDQLDQSSGSSRFSADGPLNEAAFDEFRRLYDEQAKSAEATDSFTPEALEDRALELDRVFEPLPPAAQ